MSVLAQQKLNEDEKWALYDEDAGRNSSGPEESVIPSSGDDYTKAGAFIDTCVVQAAAEHTASGGPQDPFMIIDLADVHHKISAWSELLPRISPFFAVKCFNDDAVIKCMVDRGLSFDCASMGEIQQCLDQGASPESIIFAHPVKPTDHLLFAKEQGVKKMTFDSYDELYKVAQYYPEAELVLRILPDDSAAVCQLGQKYGAHIDVVHSLLSLALELDLNVVGISFHVGSGSTRVGAFTDAVILAREAFDIAEKQLGMKSIKMLDLGGGFPGESVHSWPANREPTFQPDGELAVTFPNIAKELAPLVDKLFPADQGYMLIAEPGRYMVHSSGSLFTQIIGRRVPMYRKDGSPLSTETRYYINDGVYGSFNNIIYDHSHPIGIKWESSSTESNSDNGSDTGNSSSETVSEASVWGPTCDGLDCVLKSTRLPTLNVHDWMLFPNMGAYTIAAASVFNGFKFASKMYVNGQQKLPTN